jgi:ABC-type protease/lipase transport system fused ATPase/permease subunit
MSWLFVKRLRSFVFLAGIASLLLNMVLLMPAVYMLQVFDRVLVSGSGETLVMLGTLTLLFLGLGYFLDTVRTRVLAWAGRSLDRKLAPAAIRSSIEQAATGPGRVDTDALRDIAQLRTFLSSSGVLALFDAPWLPAYLLLIAFMHPLLGLTALAGALILIALGVVTDRLTRAIAEQVVSQSRASAKLAEKLARNAEAVLGMGMAHRAVEKWYAQREELLGSQEKQTRISSALSATARLFRQMLQVLMLAVGAWLVIDQQASAGIMIAATILLSRALAPVESLISGWRTLLEARGAWRRLEQRSAPTSMTAARAGGATADRASASDVSASGASTRNGSTWGASTLGTSWPDSSISSASMLGTSSNVLLPAPTGRIDVERIQFSFAPTRPALIKALTFSLPAGQSLGVIGPSASGKTTLVRLLLGLWRPQSGVVRLDGADISRWDRDALGDHIGYLPQDVELFAGTVGQNIARFREASGPEASEQIVRAAQLAQAHEMILQLPEGYETQIGDGGAVLSGGQRQRIALARALFGAPRFVVLDEPDAHLDLAGQAALLIALGNLRSRGVTVIVVSHNPELTAALDKLLVLKNGALELYGPTAAVRARMSNAEQAKRVVTIAPPAALAEETRA